MIEETVIVSSDEKFPLDGILVLPENLSTPVPAVVLVHGSGPNDKNEQIKKTALFKDLAEALGKQEIASIRYDKRTFVYGKEMTEDRTLSVREETIDDAVAAASLLRNDSRIDAKRIFIIGHSMGAMLAPRIDAEGGNFAGLLLLAGSPRKFEEIFIEQNNVMIAQLNKVLQWIAKKQIAALNKKLIGIYDLSDEEAQRTMVLGKHVSAYYLKEWGEHSASDYLSVLSKPIMILQGDKDFHVSVEKDFGAYQHLLADKSNVTFKLYPNLSHVFMPSQGKTIKDGLAEYDADIHLASEVANDIVNFIKEN